MKLFYRTKPITIEVEGVPSPITITDDMVTAVVTQQMLKFSAFARLADENTELKKKCCSLEAKIDSLELQVNQGDGAADPKSVPNDTSVTSKRCESLSKRYVWLYPRDVGSGFFMLPVSEKYNAPQTALLPVEHYNAESWRDSHNCTVVGEDDAQKVLEIVQEIETRKKDETKKT